MGSVGGVGSDEEVEPSSTVATPLRQEQPDLSQPVHSSLQRSQSAETASSSLRRSTSNQVAEDKSSPVKITIPNPALLAAPKPGVQLSSKLSLSRSSSAAAATPQQPTTQRQVSASSQSVASSSSTVNNVWNPTPMPAGSSTSLGSYLNPAPSAFDTPDGGGRNKRKNAGRTHDSGE